MTENPGTSGTPALPGLDLDRLTAYLAAATPDLVHGPLAGQVIAGGRSNLTYYLTDGHEQWVLRRPPLGHVLATAHDMNREYRVLSALAGTTVPVPAVVHQCTDPEPLGAPFYLMRRVEGDVLRNREQMAVLGEAGCAQLGLELIDILADLHAIDPADVGLADFGRPDGYLTRQVARWQKQLDASRSRDVPGIDALHEKLAAAIPTSRRHALLHGDYRLENVITDRSGPKIAAVLDWEMAALGDPLADLGLTMVYCGSTSDDEITAGVSGAPGFPTVADLVARYAARTGADVSDVDWYLGLAYFKLAVVLEGIHYRFTKGQTVGAGFDAIGARVPGLVADGLAALDNPSQARR